MMELMNKMKNSTQRVVLITSASRNVLHIICKSETLLLMITVATIV